VKRGIWMLALGLAPAAVLCQQASAGAADKPAPFYRQYLVAGNALDDQIVEQEHRVEASPNDASLRNDFGNLLAKRRFPEQAAEQYEMAAKLDKSNFIALYNLGLLRETEGKTSAAISAYQKSIGRKPGFPPSRFRLGRLYEISGQSQQAVAEYAVAIRIDPTMRNIDRNPLVVDAELLFLASIANYPRDLATADMKGAQVYAEEARFRAVPVDRALAAEEIADEVDALEAAEPREVSVPGTAGSSAPETPARSTRRVTPAPADAGGSVLGGRSRTPGAKPSRMVRPTPRSSGAPAPVVTPPPAEPAEVPEPPGMTDVPPEGAPEPTPTPEVPMEVEPS
jgi:tetratricopeptide (TPR) repeat protein